MNLGEVNPTSLFSDVLAAHAQEVVQAKDSPLPSRPLERDPLDDPAESLQDEVERVHDEAEEVVLAPEKREALEEFLYQLGFQPREANAAVSRATDPKGGIRLGSILKSVKTHDLEVRPRQNPDLPPGVGPQIMVLAQKLGLDKDKLAGLAKELGTGTISLKRLADALKTAGPGKKTLSGEDLAQVKEILVKAGLSENEAQSLIQNNLDPQGGISLKSLVTMFEDVVRKKDKTGMLVRSGKFSEIVQNLLEGSQTKAGAGSEAGLEAQSMTHRLKRLEADAKLKAANKKQGLKSAAQILTEKGDKIENPEQAKLKELEGMLAKGKNSAGPDSRADGRAELKASPRPASNSQTQPVFAESVKEAANQGGAKAKAGAREILAGKVAAGRAGRAEPAQPRNATPQPGPDRIDLTAARAGQSGRAQEIGQTAKAGSPRMNPSVMLEQLSGRMMMMVKNGQPIMRLQLIPPELGNLRIDLKVDGSSVRATIIAENQQVQQMLGSNSSELRQSLADQGFNLDKFEVLTQSQFQQAGAGHREGGEGRESGRSASGGGPDPETDLAEDSNTAPNRLVRNGRLDVVA